MEQDSMLGVALLENVGSRFSVSRWFRQLYSWHILLKKVLPTVDVLSNKGSMFEKDTKNS